MSNILNIVDFNPSYLLKKGTITPFIDMAALSANSRDIEYIVKKEFKSGSKFKNGDTLFARITPCLENGKTAKVNSLENNEIGHGSTEFIVLSPRDPDDEDYIYYLSRLPEFRLFAQSRMQGTSGRQRVSWQSLSEFEFSFSNKEQRKKIGKFLRKFDDKIQLNTQTNQTLEQIAQAIFKSWFIDFEPIKAKAQAIRDGKTEAEIRLAAMQAISGKTPQELTALPPEQYQPLQQLADAMPGEIGEDGVPRGWSIEPLIEQFEFIGGAQPTKSQHIYEELEGYERFIQNRDYANDNHKTYIPISKKNKRCDEKDILMDKYGEAGKIRYGIKGAYNVALAKISPKKSNIREYLRAYFSQEKIRAFLASASLASTRNSLNSSTFIGMEIVIPTDDLLDLFEKIQSEFIDKSLQIKQENYALASLRDCLLPKLLSGEVIL